MNYKLIRDNIPKIAEQEGKPIKYATVTDPAFVKELLYNKLKEEVTEFFNADLNKLEELADIMTVVGALIEVVGGTQEEFNQLYAEKLEKNGGFKGHTIGLFED